MRQLLRVLHAEVLLLFSCQGALALLRSSARLGEVDGPFGPVDEHHNGVCECLNWKKLYRKKLVTCGNGFEFTRLSMDFFQEYPQNPEDFLNAVNGHIDLAKASMNPEFCRSFFEQLDDKVCVRAGIGESPPSDKWYGKYWCYTQDECDGEYSHLATTYSLHMAPSGIVRNNMTLPTSMFARLKVCEEGKDKLLNAKQPLELMDWVKKTRINASTLALYGSYPHHKTLYLEGGSPGNTSEVQRLRKAGTPVILNEGTSHVGQVLLAGERTWRLPELHGELQCLGGCEI